MGSAWCMIVHAVQHNCHPLYRQLRLLHQAFSTRVLLHLEPG
jgi:hypothetical protein